jgi:hypothetical protein
LAFEFAYRGTQGTAKIRKLPVAASQTIVKGDPLVIASGLLNVAAGGATAATVVGIANQASDSAAAGTEVEVILCDSDTVFKADFLNSGTKKTFANADLGTAYDMGATTDYNKIDPDDTVGGSWTLVDFDNTNLHAYVKCVPAQRHPIAG